MGEPYLGAPEGVERPGEGGASCASGPQEDAGIPEGMEGPSLGIPEGLGVPEKCWRSLRGHAQGAEEMLGLATS